MPQEQSRFRPSAVPVLARVSSRLDRAIRWRIEETVGPLRERLDRLDRRIIQLENRPSEAAQKARRALTEVQRMQPQVASNEQRLEELREKVATRLDPGTPEEQQEARLLVEEVRREHEQIRARMSAIAWYEDRLRKLEERAEDGPAPRTGPA